MVKIKNISALILMMALLFGLSGVAQAAGTASQTVTYKVEEINEISVTDNPGTLTINAAAAGSEPTSVTDSTTKYAITTNGSNMKITAKIDSPMSTGLTLKVKMAAPTGGGTSKDDVTLGTTASDVVTGISKVAESGLTITYTLSATASASPEGPSQKTVTFTLLTAGS